MKTIARSANLDYVLARLAWMRREGIWPNGLRYLWTDAFGVILLASLYHELGDRQYLEQAETLITEVERVLGRTRGIRIGEEADRDGQYFHYLSMWLCALAVIARYEPCYRQRGIALAHAIHPAFFVPGCGVWWKMREDLSGPYPGYGFGALDAFDGYVAYRMLDERALAHEIADMRLLIDQLNPELVIRQDLGIGMMLWMSHLYPHEEWAVIQRARNLAMLEHMWVEDGYFCREPGMRNVKFAFTNYGVAIGLQAVAACTDRVQRLHQFFDHYAAGDEYDRAAITHVMACNSHLPGFLLKDYAAS
ncbi:MAG: hypothetical protein WD928_11665 [Gammaproteobacteria bacterium]